MWTGKEVDGTMETKPILHQGRGSAVAFFDAMNLFYAVKSLYGYRHPNFDPLLLARAVSDKLDCDLLQARYYSGIHSIRFSREQHLWLVSKSNVLKSQGVHVYTRPLQYIGDVPKEKGIDIRIALDIVHVALEGNADTIVLFSTDQDFTELNDTVQVISESQQRQIRLVSAFPSTRSDPRYGITGFDWFRIPKPMYDACIDPRDYRPRDSRPRP